MSSWDADVVAAAAKEVGKGVAADRGTTGGTERGGGTGAPSARCGVGAGRARRASVGRWQGGVGTTGTGAAGGDGWWHLEAGHGRELWGKDE
jgi:hypothetical protein